MFRHNAEALLPSRFFRLVVRAGWWIHGGSTAVAAGRTQKLSIKGHSPSMHFWESQNAACSCSPPILVGHGAGQCRAAGCACGTGPWLAWGRGACLTWLGAWSVLRGTQGSGAQSAHGFPRFPSNMKLTHFDGIKSGHSFLPTPPPR